MLRSRQGGRSLALRRGRSRRSGRVWL